MNILLDKISACIEQIIISLLEENRYSFQVSKSIKFISKLINEPTTKLDKSVDSLCLIDSYLNSLRNKNEIDLETYLSIAIYFSQVLIITFDGIWVIDDEQLVHPETMDRFWTCRVRIQVFNSCHYLLPFHMTMINSTSRNSKLNKTVNSLNFKKPVKEAYLLSELDSIIQNGDDFCSRIPFLISTLSEKLDIPTKRLNKSISSLKLVDEAIRLNGKKYLVDRSSYDSLFFLSLVIYVGEIIIKNTNGRWEISANRVLATHSLQYHWTLKIFNSSNLELNAFIESMSLGLTRMTYMNSNIMGDVRRYLHNNQNDHEYMWRDVNHKKIDRSKRVWKKYGNC